MMVLASVNWVSVLSWEVLAVFKVRKINHYILALCGDETRSHNRFYLIPARCRKLNPRPFSERIWKRRRDDSKYIWGYWTSVTQKQLLIWYKRVMPSLVPSGDISVQTAVPDRGVNKVGVLVVWLNECGQAQQKNRTCCSCVNSSRVLWLLTSPFSTRDLISKYLKT